MCSQKFRTIEMLEAESIHIFREVVAEAEKPVFLYSAGKDTAVMLHLAIKAFYPAKPPFSFLHIDTTWKFKEMIAFRDRRMSELALNLIVHTNPEGIEKAISPFTHDTSRYTKIMKTGALKQALNQHEFDVAFDGARRDEEKSRSKERIFSFSGREHRWDPKKQRPELWSLYNTRKEPDENIRVFPLSNWTEIDIWRYIIAEKIPIPELYLARERPVVERNGTLIMVDDDRMPLLGTEVPLMKMVRFRKLGCYPLSGANYSTARTTPEILEEMMVSKTSEHQGHLIDKGAGASLEDKKQDGYF